MLCWRCQARILFFSGATVWQLICFIAEWSYGKAKRKPGSSNSTSHRALRGLLRFWLRDSLHVSVLYITTAVIGDIPMAVNYVAAIRGWPWHSWWSNAVISSLLLMIAVWRILGRIQRFTQVQSLSPD